MYPTKGAVPLHTSKNAASTILLTKNSASSFVGRKATSTGVMIAV
jgi:hypothetical protein